MDLSPKLLTDVQFREQWRGYNPDEVDEFLERVASGIQELQQRLNEAMDRASNAERRLLERSDEDEIRRTLVLAQRTAVASMEEARTEADRLVSETEARCRELLSDAEGQAARLDADIATRRRLELGDLAEQRAALQLDIDHLQSFLDSERTRVADLLRGQVEWIESGYKLSELPTISDVAPPPPLLPSAPVEMRAAEAMDAPPIEDAPAVVDEIEEDSFASLIEVETDRPASAVDELKVAREELADALRRAGVERDADADAETDTGEPEAELAGDVAPLQLDPQLPRSPLFDERVGDPTGAFDVFADEPLATPEPEADEPRWRDESEEDDPFLAELRRAVIDTEPLGPRDHQHHPTGDDVGADDDDEADPGGFFRRGRRRG